jgi:hypothetical protein
MIEGVESINEFEVLFLENELEMSELKAKMIMLEHKSIITENNDLYLEGVKEIGGKIKDWAKKTMEAFKKFIAKIWTYFKSFFSKAETFMTENKEKYAIGIKNTDKTVKWISLNSMDGLKHSWEVTSLKDKEVSKLKEELEAAKTSLKDSRLDFQPKEVKLSDIGTTADAMINKFKELKGIQANLSKNVKAMEDNLKTLSSTTGSTHTDEESKKTEISAKNNLMKEIVSAQISLLKKKTGYLAKSASLIFKAYRAAVVAGTTGKSESSVFDTI